MEVKQINHKLFELLIPKICYENIGKFKTSICSFREIVAKDCSCEKPVKAFEIEFAENIHFSKNLTNHLIVLNVPWT